MIDRGFPVELVSGSTEAAGILLDDPNRVNLWVGSGQEDVEYVHGLDVREWPGLERLSSMRATLRPAPGTVGLQRREGDLAGHENGDRFQDFAIAVFQSRPDHTLSSVSRWGVRSFSMKTQKLEYLTTCMGLQGDFHPLVSLARECGELFRKQRDAMEAERMTIEVRAELARSQPKSAPMARYTAGSSARQGLLTAGAPDSAARPGRTPTAANGGLESQRTKEMERRARERRKRLGMQDGSKIWATGVGLTGGSAIKFPGGAEPTGSQARPYAQEIASLWARISAMLNSLPPGEQQKASRIVQLQLRHPEVEFMCSACQRVLRNPVLLSCGCAACRVCACIYSATSSPVCLFCGSPLREGVQTFSSSGKLEDDLIRCLPGPALAGGIDTGSFVCRVGSKPGDGTPVGMVTGVKARDGGLSIAVLYSGAGAQICSPEEITRLDVSPCSDTAPMKAGQACEVSSGPLAGLRGLALGEPEERVSGHGRASSGRAGSETILVSLEVGALQVFPIESLRQLTVSLPAVRIEARKRLLLDRALARKTAEQVQKKEEIRARELGEARTRRGVPAALPPIQGVHGVQGVRQGVQEEYRLPARYSPVRDSLPSLARARNSGRPVRSLPVRSLPARSLPGGHSSRPPPVPKTVPESEKPPWPGRNAAALSRAAEIALSEEN